MCGGKSSASCIIPRIPVTIINLNNMTAIIDYGTGNLRSVENALKRLGAEYTVTSDTGIICSADRVILPGVGEAATAMKALKGTGLDRIIPALRQPVLGICIGMQLMCSRSEEGDTPCLGIFRADVCHLASPAVAAGEQIRLKIPEMGWNSIFRPGGESSCRLLAGIEDGSYVYYVHSYAPDICEDTAAITEYGRPFSAVLARGNFFGTQFHPEKSGGIGQRILQNFLEMTGTCRQYPEK